MDRVSNWNPQSNSFEKKKVSWASGERDAERSISMALQFGLFSILNFFHLPTHPSEKNKIHSNQLVSGLHGPADGVFVRMK
jgi:hypothetical protein